MAQVDVTSQKAGEAVCASTKQIIMATPILLLGCCTYLDMH